MRAKYSSSNPFQPTVPGSFLILLYHGVYPDGLGIVGRNGSGKHIPASEFQRQMKIIKEQWNSVSMLDIEAAYQGKKDLPVESVAITFDDGYCNVYETAWPILKELELPFTLYLTTDWIGTGKHSWTDELEDMFWGTGFAATLTEFKTVLKQVSFEELEQFMAGLKTVFPCGMGHPLYQMMTWGQVKKMAKSPFVAIGAHTVDHKPLARVDICEMKLQVRESLEKVQEQAGGTPLFSYPEGQEGDISDRAIEYLRFRGINICPTAIPGVNNIKTTDPMRLYRCAPGLGGQWFVLSDLGEQWVIL